MMQVDLLACLTISGIELDELALSTLSLHLVESIYALVMHEATTRAVWQRLHEMYDGSELSRTRARQRRSRRHVTCWHCGHTGHVGRRCFDCMRECRRAIRDADAVMTSREDVVAGYASDGDVTLSSSLSPDYFMSLDGATSSTLVAG